MSWYVLQLKPGQGERALENLQNQDIRCFYPKVTVEKIHGGRRQKKLEPLFPGYMFIKMEQTDPLWAKLRSTRGVSRVVGFANKPLPLRDDVIDKIRESLDVVSEQGGIRQGQTLEISEGPFKGLSAIFQSYDGTERAIVLIEFMQRQQSVKVHLSSIRS